MPYAHPHDVEVPLGRSLTDLEVTQAVEWIQQAEMEIASRAQLGALDAEILRTVIAEAVARRMRNPDAISRREVQIDDGRIATTSHVATGQIEILPQWWRWLGIRPGRAAFTVRPRLAR